MFAAIKDIKKKLYRQIKYVLVRAKPPTTGAPLDCNVVILGSAPVSHIPAGFDASYKLITVNGSQGALDDWDRPEPDITLIQYNQIEGQNLNATEVRRVLHGRRTGLLMLLLWRHGLPRLEAGLRSFDYRYRQLKIVNRYERIALLEKVTGERNFELDAETKYSNGIIAILFALHNGARAVIITGINPSASGHRYNTQDLARMHTNKDSEMLSALIARGYPVFTADPAVSASTGLPLWKGQA